MSVSDRINSELLSAKCDFLVESQIWPLEQELDYQGWLRNFTGPEQPYAECLINGFLYFSETLTKHLFNSAFQHLVPLIVNCTAPLRSSLRRWDEFQRTILVTQVTGEQPNPTDSGYHFTRLARTFLGIDESQIVSNERAVEEIYMSGPRPIVFVDDFVGSGNQFCKTWVRTHELAADVHVSFKKLMGREKFKAYYCPLVCTSNGKAKIASCAPEVDVVPAHLIDESYSVFCPTTPVWPESLRPTAEEFIRTASLRAGILDGWRGFQDLGLLLAFEHGVPDATLPLMYHESETWKPLVRRS